MSDRHAAEKLFKELLADYRSEMLPDVVSGWAEASETERGAVDTYEQFLLWITFPGWISRLC